jgi:type IV secretory pathway VirB3-like protein
MTFKNNILQIGAFLAIIVMYFKLHRHFMFCGLPYSLCCILVLLSIGFIFITNFLQRKIYLILILFCVVYVTASLLGLYIFASLITNSEKTCCVQCD